MPADLKELAKIQSEYNEALLDLFWLLDPHEITLRSTNAHLEMLTLKYGLIANEDDSVVDKQIGLKREVIVILLNCNARLAALASQ